jgi:hypothetical protein
MSKSSSLYRNILRILGTIAAILYILFLVFEGVPLFNNPTFAETTVYLLFLIFVVGYYFLWKNEFLSGLILVVWHIIQWILVFFVWPDGGITLILGLPIGILGILVLIYGIRKKKASKNTS